MAEAGREGQARGARYHLGPLPSPARPGGQHSHMETQGQSQLREACFEADFPFCLLPTSVSHHFWGVHLFHSPGRSLRRILLKCQPVGEVLVNLTVAGGQLPR